MNILGRAPDGPFVWPTTWTPAGVQSLVVPVEAVGGLVVSARLHVYPAQDSQEHRRSALGQAIGAILKREQGQPVPCCTLVYGAWGSARTGALLLGVGPDQAPTLIASLTRDDGAPVTSWATLSESPNQFRGFRSHERRQLREVLSAVAELLCTGGNPGPGPWTGDRKSGFVSSIRPLPKSAA